LIWIIFGPSSFQEFSGLCRKFLPTGLRLVPVGEGFRALKEDYARIIEDGLLLEDAEPFEALIARCVDVADRANREAERRRGGRPPGASLYKMAVRCHQGKGKEQAILDLCRNARRHDEIRDELVATKGSHYDRLDRKADDVARLGFDVAAGAVQRSSRVASADARGRWNRSARSWQGA
jgi:hypothetical protein